MFEIDYELMMKISGAVFTACVVMVCVFSYYGLFMMVKEANVKEEINETIEIVNNKEGRNK